MTAKNLKIRFVKDGEQDNGATITFYGTAARIEGIKAALLTREFSISVDGVGKMRSAAIVVDGVRYSAKIKDGEQAAAILNYNKAARNRKEAQKAAAIAATPPRKSFEEYATENPADLCNLMNSAQAIAKARRGDDSELRYYFKQVADLEAALTKAKAAKEKAQAFHKQAQDMSAAEFAQLVIEATEAQHAHEDEIAREKRAKRKEDSGITALAAKYGITAEALTKALEAEAAAAMFADTTKVEA